MLGKLGGLGLGERGGGRGGAPPDRIELVTGVVLNGGGGPLALPLGSLADSGEEGALRLGGAGGPWGPDLFPGTAVSLTGSLKPVERRDGVAG